MIRLTTTVLLLILVAQTLPAVETFTLSSLASKIGGSIDARTSPHQLWAVEAQEAADEKLLRIAQTLKLDNNGYDTRDSNYGLEAVRTSVDLQQNDGALGLMLSEMARSAGGRGLVLISEVGGNAAFSAPEIKVGDVLTAIDAGEGFRKCVAGSNYDDTVEVILAGKEIALAPNGDGKLYLELNRLVKRARVVVQVDIGTSTKSMEALAGENLRRLLLRNKIEVGGACGGEGECGTCTVDIKNGMEMLSDIGKREELLLKGKPESRRAACQTVVGANNEEGTIKISTNLSTYTTTV